MESRTPRRTARDRTLARLYIGAVAVSVVVLLVLGIAAVSTRYWPAIEGALGARTAADALVARFDSLGPGDVDAATMAALRGEIDTLDRRLRPALDLLRDDPLVDLARSVPALRDDLAAADVLATAIEDLLEAAHLGAGLGDRLAALMSAGGGDGRIAGAVTLMAESVSTVDRIDALATEALASLRAIPASVSPQLLAVRDRLIGPLDRSLVLLDGYRALDDRLPAVLGSDGPRRYLVLAQNPAELRPTGGFIGTYGILEMDAGRIVSVAFHDVYVLDNQRGMPYQEPPPALADTLLGRASWELADANWSPDFPTAAAQALRLYTIESGDADIDGVIGITTFAIDRLLEVLGPVDVPGTQVTVHPGEMTVIGIANTREGAAGEDRKRFLAVVADEVLRRLLTLEPDRWAELVAALEDIGRQRLIQAWFPDAADQALVAGTRWSGALPDGPGDQLSIVDANVGPSSKLSIVVQRSTDLTVELAADGSATHHLRLGWHNDADRPGEPYETLRAASESASGAYGVLVRLLVPEASALEELTGESALPLSGVEYEEIDAGRRSWGNYLLIPPGPASLQATWRTPGQVRPDAFGEHVYALTLHKQPGMLPEPVEVTIRAPEGHGLERASAGMVIEDGAARWQGLLTEDVELVVWFSA